VNRRMWHFCAAPGCHDEVALALLMCPKHWWQVEASLRSQVSGAWQAWRRAVDEDEPDAVERFQTYMAARRAAIGVLVEAAL